MRFLEKSKKSRFSLTGPGQAISFVSHEDGRKWNAIEKLLNPEFSGNDKSHKNGKKKGKPYRKKFSNKKRKAG